MYCFENIQKTKINCNDYEKISKSIYILSYCMALQMTTICVHTAINVIAKVMNATVYYMNTFLM